MPDLVPFRGASLPARASRSLSKIEGSTLVQLANERSRARVVEERHRSSIQALEGVAAEAIHAGSNLTRLAITTAHAVPGSEHFSGRLLDAAATAMGQVLSDTARDLRS